MRQVYRRIADLVGDLDQDAVVLDIGGGTGLSRAWLNLPPQYLCLDIDRDKLATFNREYGIGNAIQADGSHLPIKDGAVDLALCVNVSHHLTDDVLTSLVRETMRALKNNGRFVFVDAVWDPFRTVSKMLWHYDRGSTPHTTEAFHALFTQEAVLRSWEVLPIYHHYLIAVLARQNGGGVT